MFLRFGNFLAFEKFAVFQAVDKTLAVSFLPFSSKSLLYASK